MSEEKQKILKKIKESLKTCEQNLLERLEREENNNETSAHFGLLKQEDLSVEYEGKLHVI